MRKFIKRPCAQSKVTCSYADEYIDVGGGLGHAGDRYSLQDLQDIYHEGLGSDPVIQQYGSFDDWMRDTTSNYFQPVATITPVLREEAFNFLDEGYGQGYWDYNQAVEDVMEEFLVSRDDAEGIVFDYVNAPKRHSAY